MKRLFPFLLALLLLAVMGQILVSYGVFETDVEVGTETPVAAWQIVVNGNQLTDVPQTFDITNVNWQSSSNVLPGRVAPNLEAYFEIIIDPSGTEVGIEYELEIKFSEIGNDHIIIQSVKDSDDNDLTETAFETYKGVISLLDVLDDKIETIRVTFTWENDESNNQVDSNMANIFNSEFVIPLNIRVLQYIE